MKAKIIKTAKEYESACARVYALMQRSEDLIESDSPEGDEIQLLSLLIEKYEQEHFSIGPPTPVEAIRFRLDQMNLKQGDIAPLFGGKTRVSEILHGKRPLTLKIISLLNLYLGIPLESLIKGNKKFKIETIQRRKLLSVPAIRNAMAKVS